MKLLNEDQILDPEFRKKVIEDIRSPANVARKTEAKKRYEVYKDNTVEYVMLKLKREIKHDETLALMENRAANVSICKKIINKIGRVYGNPPTRKTGNETSDIQVTELAKLINFNQKQKKVDRYTRLFKNCLPWFYMDKVNENEYRLCQKVFSPWQYDALENPNDPEDAAVIILSDFIDRQSLNIPAGGQPQVTQLEAQKLVQSESSIAMASNSIPVSDTKTFIWWSNKYHFTTDEKGSIVGVGSVTPPDLLNPIGIIPGVPCGEDQDGTFWAEGGQDLVDGSILINTMLTDRNAIAYMQGWGQLVITGQHIPQEFMVGPHHALTLTYDAKKDEAEPKVYMVNANPPLKEWAEMIEQTVAMILSTNNLSPSTVAGSLNLNQMASGVAMLIDRSESTDSIKDKQVEFYWIEMKEWEIIKRWHNLFLGKKLLIKNFSDIGQLPDDLRVTVQFVDDTGEVLSEADRLANLQKRKDLGLASQLDLVLKDNPGMTQDEAQAKLDALQAQNLQYMPVTTAPTNGNKSGAAAAPPQTVQ
jgi:hypothetical protein